MFRSEIKQESLEAKHVQHNNGKRQTFPEPWQEYLIELG